MNTSKPVYAFMHICRLCILCINLFKCVPAENNRLIIPKAHIRNKIVQLNFLAHTL